MKLAVARVGKRPKDDAGVFIDGMPKIHGEAENDDQEEEIDDCCVFFWNWASAS
jgi:hypothetical protein